MGSFVIGIIVIIITFYIALIYASTAIGLLGFAEAVLFVLAFLYLLYLSKKLHISIQIPLAAAEQGGSVSVQIHAANDSHFYCARIQYRLRCGSTFSGRLKSTWENGAAVYPGKNRYQAKMQLPYAGNYMIELVRFRVYDKTGIFYINRKMQQSAAVLVLPEVEAVAVRISEPARNFYGDADVYDDFRPGNDRSEIFDVRGFQQGDKIQSIHWKLSAKSGELVVREDSLPRACPVALILAYTPNRSSKEPGSYLSIAASLVFSLMDAACPHYVAWYSTSRQDIVRARVDDEEGYYTFLCRYLADIKSGAGGTPEQLYQEKYRYDRPLYRLVLRSDLSLWQNGERIAVIDGHNWKKSMEGLELLL